MMKPVILSASRSTDIPAFYADWFFKRLEIGWCSWINPFNNVTSQVSFEDLKFIVFWSKNPRPIIPYLHILKEKGIGFYFQYTLNDYSGFDLENVPGVVERLETFKTLASDFCPVVWRFDPLILIEGRIGKDILLERIWNVGKELTGYTDKLVFSFADISSYYRVKRNLTNENIPYIEWTEDMMRDFCKDLLGLGLKMELATCGEGLSVPGISKNRCVDPVLIKRIMPGLEIDEKKDKGQRLECGCIKSKDIGQYNTCLHLCKYCYANTNAETVRENWNRHLANPNGDLIF